jgi:hypothetical protein
MGYVRGQLPARPGSQKVVDLGAVIHDAHAV